MAQIDKQETTTSTRDFVLGALIGGAVGAATALFLAPKSGKEFRDDLTLQAELLKERSAEWKEQAIDKSSELANAAKEKTAVLSQTVQDQSSGLVEKVKSIKGEAATPALEDAVDQTADTVEKATDIAAAKLNEVEEAIDSTEKTISENAPKEEPVTKN
ncbi:YtxH domain-containing protein [Jeotgalibacillus soli]|uniref:General stress protein n=1 Tax=Jeotgalibacillus soli TaxID=889306 RepID=A0A0C2V4C4_9BACL|nr:YtxH domain-containing protein [Jeotgalibacillus soli]KIL43882.1 hypothetical protein KP78_37060 [Jeotgalibacillus soli]